MKLRYLGLGLTVALVALAACEGPPVTPAPVAFPALRMDTRGLPDGVHHIEAEVAMADGTVKVVSAEFCVDNGPVLGDCWATPAPAPTATVRPTATIPCHLDMVVDLNNSPAETIAVLPRDTLCRQFGLTLARAVVDARGTQGYATLADLDRVPGIGPGIIAAVRACLCVTPQ